MHGAAILAHLAGNSQQPSLWEAQVACHYSADLNHLHDSLAAALGSSLGREPHMQHFPGCKVQVILNDTYTYDLTL